MSLNIEDRASRLEAEIAALGPWFHNIEIEGVRTAPDHFLGDYPAVKWQTFAHAVPDDLRGASVLDVGCNAGFYSVEMKRRGAARVVGIDTEPLYLKQAEFVFERMGAEIELHQMSVYDVEKLGEKFDFVVFMGVLYHLRHPLLALDLLHEHVVGDLMLFQSMQRGSAVTPELAADYQFFDESPFDSRDFPLLYFIENRYADDPTNWFVPNKAAAEAMLRSAGFVIAANPEREVYLCRRGERPDFAEPVPRIR
jgi:tRNA (mo5U34)-methyltransferase